MGLDQSPVNAVAEKPIDVPVFCRTIRTMKHQVFDAADSRHQFDSQQMRQREDRIALCLGIAMNRIGLDV